MKNNKGITLIALVITIIVLLILAGVSIAMLTGENGILSNATEAQEETARENAIERINLALQAIKTQTLAEQNDDATFDPINETTDLTGLYDPNIIGIGADEIAATKTSGKFYISTSTTGADAAKTATITINYSETEANVDVTGSITFSAANPSGLISGAEETSGT